MGEHTEIAWCHHTFSPWWGCEKVSPGCAHCYAETFARRVGRDVWGKDAPRRVVADATWRNPLKWDRMAREAGERRRVFCGSMCDVFEDRRDLDVHRRRLARLVWETQNLDWLFLTKRIESAKELLYEMWFPDAEWPSNVWIGTTVENQAMADARIPVLLSIPATVRFLSVEPMLGPVDLTRVRSGAWSANALTGHAEGPVIDIHGRNVRMSAIGEVVHWVICGGESGPKARPFDLAWARSLRDQCRAAGVAFFMKQDSGTIPGLQGRAGDDLWNTKEFPKT